MVPQTVSETSTLVTQVLSLLFKPRPGHVHEHSQHCIKPVHGLQPGSSVVLHEHHVLHGIYSIHCPGVRAEMSEGQDKVLRALTSVPRPLVLQGWSECTELLPLFILVCSSDDIFSTAASSQKKKNYLLSSNHPLVSAVAANSWFRGKNNRACKSFY